MPYRKAEGASSSESEDYGTIACLSCSAFSSRSQALLMSEIILPSFGVYGF